MPDLLPREKLQTLGLDAMTLSELLAIVLNTGTRKENVLELSARLINDYGSEALKPIKNPSQAEKRLGIPPVKACQIVALFEIGRRIFQQTRKTATEIRRPQDAFNHPEALRESDKEQFIALYLNTRNRIIYEEVISIGSLEMSVIHPRELFAPALEHRASRLILVHNHPSGDPTPSENDMKTTETLIAAGRLLHIPIVDHVIITKSEFLSLKEAGFVKF